MALLPTSMKPRPHAKTKRPRPVTPSRNDGERLRLLTPRETEVLGWIMQGKRDAEIGKIFEISENTVHKHAQRIYAKLGVETRTAAAHVAWEAGFKPAGGAR